MSSMTHCLALSTSLSLALWFHSHRASWPQDGCCSAWQTIRFNSWQLKDGLLLRLFPRAPIPKDWVTCLLPSCTESGKHIYIQCFESPSCSLGSYLASLYTHLPGVSFLLTRIRSCWMLMVHTCNHSYSRDRDQKD
jgi:hypothetical protein